MVDSVAVEPVCNKNEAGVVVIKEDCTGFNSEDEYDDQGLIKDRNLPDEEWQKVFTPKHVRCMFLIFVT